MSNAANKIKDLGNKIIMGILMIIILLLSLKMCQVQTQSEDTITSLKKSILASDKLVKEADGRYSKLVDYYHSERDLMKDLKSQNRELYNKIKQQDERLLSITNAIVTLDKKVVQGFGQFDKVDTNKINFSLKYPEEKDPFIYWDGWVNKETAAYRGTFSFGKLPLQIVLTEESRGLWKSRLVGPEWLKVDSLSIVSLPPEKYPTVKPKNIQWLFGGSYYTRLNSKEQGIGVNFGLNLFDRHNLIVGANSLQQVTVGYLHKVKSFKRNK